MLDVLKVLGCVAVLAGTYLIISIVLGSFLRTALP